MPGWPAAAASGLSRSRWRSTRASSSQPPTVRQRSEPALLHDLARRRLWLEQESTALDPRLAEALVEHEPAP